MSFIFSNSELEEINRRKNGDRSDKFGLFSNRIRPKINEILLMDLDELKSLIEKKPNTKSQ